VSGEKEVFMVTREDLSRRQEIPSLGKSAPNERSGDDEHHLKHAMSLSIGGAVERTGFEKAHLSPQDLWRSGNVGTGGGRGNDGGQTRPQHMTEIYHLHNTIGWGKKVKKGAQRVRDSKRLSS